MWDTNSWQLVPTADGSYTLFDPGKGVHYHSLAGAEGESRHVFLEGARLAEMLLRYAHLHILEVGLGTGLNALLTAELSQGYTIQYTALEPHPLPQELLRAVHGQRFPAHWVEALYRHPAQAVALGDLRLTWQPLRLQDALLPAAFFQLIYYDPFAPQSAPELWAPEALSTVYNALARGGRLATYSISGATKRWLRSQGIPFRRPRGFGPKREMLVLEKP